MRNTFCLDSVSTCQQISGSPLNRSSSKHLWSFSKDSRFKSPRPYCDSIYEVPSTFRNKGAAIGYGSKADWTKDLTCSPGSSRYNMRTIFDDNTKSKKGFSISLSREKIPSKGYIPLDPLKVPAPTKYNNQRLPDLAHRYSMRSKTKIIDKTMSIQSQNVNPGAGRYENPQAMSPRGKYSVSKHKGTGASLFNPKSSIRFFEFSNRNPGPGAYQEVNKLSDSGHYTLSMSNGFGKRLFDKETRMTKFEKQAKLNLNPGPGSYRSPSDFGHYDGDLQMNNLSFQQTRFSRTNSQSKLNSTSNRSFSRKKL